jgi:hypothetical protein
VQRKAGVSGRSSVAARTDGSVSSRSVARCRLETEDISSQFLERNIPTYDMGIGRLAERLWHTNHRHKSNLRPDCPVGPGLVGVESLAYLPHPAYTRPTISSRSAHLPYSHNVAHEARTECTVEDRVYELIVTMGRKAR